MSLSPSESPAPETNDEPRHAPARALSRDSLVQPASPRPLPRAYFAFFLFYYYVEGALAGTLMYFLPFFLMSLEFTGLDEAYFSLMGSIVAIPFSVKILWGVLTDRFRLGKLGRRRPMACGGPVLAGVTCVAIVPAANGLAGGTVPVETGLNGLLALAFLVQLGTAVGDTALDGFILDVTPTARIGRVNGATKATYVVGQSMGGVVSILLYVVATDLALVLGITATLALAAGGLVCTLKEPPGGREFNWPAFKRLLAGRRNWASYLYIVFANVAQALIIMFYLFYALIAAGVVASTQETGLTLVLMDLGLVDSVVAASVCLSSGAFLGSWAAGRLADRVPKKKLMTGVVLLNAAWLPVASFLVTSFATGLVVLFFVGITNASLLPVAYAFVSPRCQARPETASTHFSIYTSMMNIGGALGFLVISLVITAFYDANFSPLQTYPWIFTIAPLLTLPSLFFMGWFEDE